MGWSGQEEQQQLLGVSYDPGRSKWKARIHFAGQERYLGRYKTSMDAALAYDQAASYINTKSSQQNGRRRQLNFPHLNHSDPVVTKRLTEMFEGAGCLTHSAELPSRTAAAAADAAAAAAGGGKVSTAANTSGSPTGPAAAAAEECSTDPSAGIITRTSSGPAAAAAGGPGSLSTEAAAVSPLMTAASAASALLQQAHQHASPALAAPATAGAPATVAAPTSASHGKQMRPGGLKGRRAQRTRPAVAASAAASTAQRAAGEKRKAAVLDASAVYREGVQASLAAQAGSLNPASGTASWRQAVQERIHQQLAQQQACLGDIQQQQQHLVLLQQQLHLQMQPQEQQPQQQPVQQASQLAAAAGVPGEGEGAFAAGEWDDSLMELLQELGSAELQDSNSSRHVSTGDSQDGSGQQLGLDLLTEQQQQQQQQQPGSNSRSNSAEAGVDAAALVDKQGLGLHGSVVLHAGSTRSSLNAAAPAGLLQSAQYTAAARVSHTCGQELCATFSPQGPLWLPHQVQQLPGGRLRQPALLDTGVLQEGQCVLSEASEASRPRLQLPELLPRAKCCEQLSELLPPAGQQQPAEGGQAAPADLVQSGSAGGASTGAFGTCIRQRPTPHELPDAAPAAAGAEAPAAGTAGALAGSAQGLLACISTPAQVRSFTSSCQHLLTDLHLHVLQQPKDMRAVGAMVGWLQAAWHREVLGSLDASAGPAAVAAATAVAQVEQPNGSASQRLALRMLDHAVLLAVRVLTGCDVAIDEQREFLLELFARLQQGLGDLQCALVANAPAAAAAGQPLQCSQFLQAWARSIATTGGSAAVVQTLQQLVQLL